MRFKSFGLGVFIAVELLRIVVTVKIGSFREGGGWGISFISRIY